MYTACGLNHRSSALDDYLDLSAAMPLNSNLGSKLTSNQAYRAMKNSSAVEILDQQRLGPAVILDNHFSRP